MDSSISRFKWIPTRAVWLLATAMATWVVCALYMEYLNPEITNCRQGDEIKRAWTKQLTQEHGSKIIIYGGSSCEFSIDGERLLANYKEPLVNDGRVAGIGVVVLTESVLGDLHRGDTLIVALEPAGLTGSLEGEPSLAVQFSLAVHHPEWVLHPELGMGKVNLFEAAVAMRPGGYHTFTLLGKIIRHQPMYRYQLSDYHRSGWMQTAVRVPMTGGAGHGPHLSDDGRTFLTSLTQWCRTNGVRVAYSLPWSYCPGDELRSFQRGNGVLLSEIMAFLPVLRDRSLGADPVADDFADTGWHLTESGAARRTDELGREIQQWDTWTREDLDRATADLRDLAQGPGKQ